MPGIPLKAFFLYYIVSLCLIICNPGGNCLSQQKDKDKLNLELLEENISGELEKFFYYPDVDRRLQFVFVISSAKNDKQEIKFIESVVKKAAEKNNLNISIAKDESSQSADSEYYRVKIEIHNLKTLYPRFGKNTFLGDKSLVREVSADLAVEIKSNNGTSLVKDNIISEYRGEIPYDEYERFETAEYNFTQSVPPNISFLETIIFPAAIITASAVAAILFFTIRSK